MKNDEKFEQELTGQFKIDMRNLTIFDSIICTLMGCFWPKNVMFELRKCRGVMFDGTQDWYKILKKPDCYQKWHDGIGKFSRKQVRKSKNWDFYWVLLSKVENVWV